MAGPFKIESKPVTMTVERLPEPSKKVWLARLFKTNKLVGWWNFDEGKGDTAHDSIGKNDGAIRGTTWTTGKIGGALDFDGDDYVDIGNDASIQIEVFTVTAWIKTSDSAPRWQTILSYESQSHAVSLLPNGHVHYGWQRIKRGVEGTTDVRSGEWVFVAVMRDSDDSASIYVNGEREDSFICDTDSAFSHSAKIGGDVIDSEYFNGLIDDVRIYNYALSEDEVAAVYAGKELTKRRNWAAVLVVLVVVVIVVLLAGRKRKAEA